jgi:GT2 family glycosyltransferase
MLLSIIIINYNTFNLTCDCIRSIKNTATIDYEILLIDNNSKECAADQFLKLFPEIKLTALKENIGFGRANNLGMEKASGKYFLLLNSDTVVLENTINETVDFFEKNPDADVLGCRSLYPDGSNQLTVYSYGNEKKLLYAIKFFFKKNAVVNFSERVINYCIRKIKGNSTALKEQTNHEIVLNYNNGERIGSMMGVFLLIRQSVYRDTRGFDPDFFMYYEESEWFLRRLRNHNIVYYPKVSIIHYYGKSDVYKKMNLQYHVSAYLFWYKFSYWHYFFFTLFNLIDIPAKLIMSIITFDRTYLKELVMAVKALPYAFFEIPRYSNAFGARNEMLKLKYLKINNL